MTRWLRPAYPIDWALAGMDGSVLLELEIDPQGQPTKTTVAQGSGSSELDESALRAANFWRFAPPLWKSEPVGVVAELEVRFNFFGFEFSRLGEPAAGTSDDHGGENRNRERPIGGREHALGHVIEELQFARPPRTFDAPGAAGLRSLMTAARDWGPVAHIKYLGAVGEPEWQTYAIKPEYRGDPPVNSVSVRWELYRVEHASRTSLWKVAFDRRNQAWAIKADALSAEGQ